MADITYKCPKCNATLKPGRPIPAGKKIKCPKCENIFAPDGEPKEAKTAAAKPQTARPKPDDDDEGAGTYGFREDPAPPKEDLKAAVEPGQDDDDEDRPRKKKAAAQEPDDASLKQRGEKRKKGAAQAICQPPSNKLLANSIFSCVSCILSLLTVLWQVFFSDQQLTSGWDVAGATLPRWVWLLLTIVAFGYHAVIIVGAVKLQGMESLSWAFTASILELAPTSWFLAVPTFIWFYKLIDLIAKDSGLVPATVVLVSIWYVWVGVWNLMTLRNEDVVAAFAEKDVD